MPNDKSFPPTQTIAETRRSEQGFSIIELLTSIIIFSIVVSAIYATLQVSRRLRSQTNNQVAITKNVRVALNLMGRDTYNAGFGYPVGNTVVLPDNRISTLLTIPNDFDSTRDIVPPVIAGNNMTLNTYNAAPNIRTDQVTFFFKDSSFNVSNGISQPLDVATSNTVSGIDELVPVTGSNVGFRLNDIFLVTGNTGSALGQVTALSGANIVQFANGDSLNFNQPGSGNPLRSITLPATLQRVNMVSYFVTADGILTRREYGNTNIAPPGVATPANFRDEPIVYGVENFQIQYVMDDGALSDNPSAGADGIPGTNDDVQANLAKVRQVRYTITIRSVERLEVSNSETRVTMTSTFSTRNMGYDAS